MAEATDGDATTLSRRPFALQTNLVSYLIAGGTLLPRFLGEQPAKESGDRPSQMWVASTVASALGDGCEGLSRLAGTGGAYLKTLLDAEPELFLGAAHARAWGANPGFLVKLINARDRLRVQVHPDRATAKRYFGLEFGKTEAWHVVDAEQGATAYAGFRPGVTRAVLRDAILVQDSAAILALLHAFPVVPGDTMFIPAGLPHALGPGSLVVEIQEPIDVTLRAEGRLPSGALQPETFLHAGIGMDALLDCFTYTERNFEAARRAIFIAPTILRREAAFVEEDLISAQVTDCFGMSLVTVAAGRECRKTNEGFTVAIVLDGEGSACGGSVRIPLRRSTELFIPNGVESYAYAAEKTLWVIECHPPSSRGAAGSVPASTGAERSRST
jgi:mannose-6-phosphate isomerase